MDLVDFRKLFPGEYAAKKAIVELHVGPATYFSVDGKGSPGGEAFQEAIGALFAAIYTTKFALKHAGVVDFKISPLSCRWGFCDPVATPKEEWTWSMEIRVPDAVTGAHLEETRSTLLRRKGQDVSIVRRVALEDGRCLQVLHVGPYEGVCEVYRKLHERAAELGTTFSGLTREFYISDPRRVPPEKLKTIVRVGIRHPEAR